MSQNHFNRSLSLQAWQRRLHRNTIIKWKLKALISVLPKDERALPTSMLFLRLDQLKQLLHAAVTMRETLVIRYLMFNGLCPMELANSRIEYLDPVECALYLPKRHWKRNCITDIDPETVKLQVIYSENRTEGPLIRTYFDKPPHRTTINNIVKRVAQRTSIPGKRDISPLILKRTFAREWLRKGSVGTLQKQLSHKHLWSTAHYLRFVLDDVKPDHKRLMQRVDPSPRRQKKIE